MEVTRNDAERHNRGTVRAIHKRKEVKNKTHSTMHDSYRFQETNVISRQSSMNASIISTYISVESESGKIRRHILIHQSVAQ
jgi:hypothetical protein